MLAGVLLKSVLLLLGEQPDTPRDMTSLAAVCRDWWTTLTSQRLKGWPKLLSINCAVHVMKAFMSEKKETPLTCILKGTRRPLARFGTETKRIEGEKRRNGTGERGVSETHV